LNYIEVFRSILEEEKQLIKTEVLEPFIKKLF